jgi:hypothetical protein
MSIPDHARTNFQTLLRAATDGNLALMECNDAVTGEPRYVICAVGRDGTDFVFAPFGHLADGNPYDAYLPPSETLPDRSAICSARRRMTCLGAAVRGSTGKPFPHRLRRCVTLEAWTAPARRSAATRGSGGDERCAGFSTSTMSAFRRGPSISAAAANGATRSGSVRTATAPP